ncbi:AEC family transporter [Pararhizobium sp. IMCC21322]|uniref:AEC family transporter n=1 Tax=Pararhizobium sp. IMCC21322 TaxID=3067903 RepID=UPI0027408C64|nr:AEC family transporter [Pararhizobium sp. IMCC21322]
MLQVATLAFPFFGLIFLGFFAGRIFKVPAEGLAWLNIFIIYFALPALFFQLISKTPIEELANWTYVFSTSFSTYCAFALAFCIGIYITRGNVAVATIQGMVGGYANVGYMGPGLTLAVLGPEAAVPAALIFCFDVALVFTLAPLLMAFAGTEKLPPFKLALQISRKVFLHPFIIATIAGVLGAAFHFEPPQAVDTILTFLSSAAAPSALFAMGVTVALRPLKRFPVELPGLLAVKLIAHPLIAYLMLGVVGDFDPVWVATGVLMASLPPAATIYVIAQQYNVYIERASTAVLVGTGMSVATVTLVLYLIASGALGSDLVRPIP